MHTGKRTSSVEKDLQDLAVDSQENRAEVGFESHSSSQALEDRVDGQHQDRDRTVQIGLEIQFPMIASGMSSLDYYALNLDEN